MNPHADPADRLERRAAELVAAFTTIARTRMAGVPMLNAALQVEAVGFEAFSTDDGDAPAGLGVLITPWFMNLVRLPLQREDAMAGVGRGEKHRFGCEVFEFIGAHEPALGAFSACSLFSPMFEFADQAAARATAQAVLAALRPAAASMPAPTPAPARRSFLFGRSAAP